MKKDLSPICPDTTVGVDPHEWIPRNFEGFLKELDHIIDSCDGRCPLFRGHADRRWLLESSFVRTCKKLLLDVEPHIRPSQEIRESVEYHQALFGLLLLKYDVLVRPSAELRDLETQRGADAMFEMLKHFQQFPEDDKATLKGTFYLDWTQNRDVGLFFANFHSDEHSISERNTDGTLFICDKTVAGKCLMREESNEAIRVEKIIELMREKNNTPENDEGFGCPLLFYPPRQIYCQRADNQEAAYWAQMDLRYDLEYIWSLKEKDGERHDYILRKLILPCESQKECADYLCGKGITHSYLFPISSRVLDAPGEG